MVRHLRAAGQPVYAPRRAVPGVFDHDLGHVIYAIGLTADFRSRPIDTIEAHVSALAEVLRCARFESLTYLSSTRVYGGATHGHEDGPLVANPCDPGDLYNLSKMAGEALCLSQPDSSVRVARLANVFGTDMDANAQPSQNFLAALVREATDRGTVVLRSAPDSAKDYVAIEDATRALHRIALDGQHRLYNVASGVNTTNADIAAALRAATGCLVKVADGAPCITFPLIDVTRIGTLFPSDDPWMPASVLDRLPEIVSARRAAPAAAAGGMR
jgi:nucleoside-diphosphate-sugar epimerase